MDIEVIEELKKEFNKIISEEPFNGQVTHRTRPIFVQKWKQFLRDKGIKGEGWLDDLIRTLRR